MLAVTHRPKKYTNTLAGRKLVLEQFHSKLPQLVWFNEQTDE